MLAKLMGLCIDISRSVWENGRPDGFCVVVVCGNLYGMQCLEHRAGEGAVFVRSQ
jgi:hypothetical protein